MFVTALRIALAKIDSSMSSHSLGRALDDAITLERVESEFEARINRSKAARGESPAKLAKSQRVQIAQYTADAASLQAEQLAAFAEMSCLLIVTVLKSGLDSDLQFWTTAAKHTDPADRPVVEELVNAKRSLQRSLAACLAVTPA